MILLTLAALTSMASARPSFIAVPADQIAFIDLSSLHMRRVPRQIQTHIDLSSLHMRVPRQTLTPPPPPPVLPQALYEQQQQFQPIPLLPAQGQQEYQPIPLLPAQYQQQPIQPEPAPVVEQHSQPLVQQEDDTIRPYDDRPPDFGEYVDFGAHTGDNGAFGWYADYPLNNHHDSSFRK